MQFDVADDANLGQSERKVSVYPDASMLNMDPRDVEKYRASNEITVVRGGSGCPNPITNFADGGFPDYVMTEIKRANFNEPTAIQVG